MGAVFRREMSDSIPFTIPDSGGRVSSMEVGPPETHVSTGKWPYGAGENRHVPVWGEWLDDWPMQIRHCTVDHCDLEDYRWGL